MTKSSWVSVTHWTLCSLVLFCGVYWACQWSGWWCDFWRWWAVLTQIVLLKEPSPHGPFLSGPWRKKLPAKLNSTVGLNTSRFLWWDKDFLLLVPWPLPRDCGWEYPATPAPWLITQLTLFKRLSKVWCLQPITGRPSICYGRKQAVMSSDVSSRGRFCSFHDVLLKKEVELTQCPKLSTKLCTGLSSSAVRLVAFRVGTGQEAKFGFHPLRLKALWPSSSKALKQMSTYICSIFSTSLSLLLDRCKNQAYLDWKIKENRICWGREVFPYLASVLRTPTV